MSNTLKKRYKRVRKALDLSAPIMLKPTFAEDGLISSHVVDFMRDERFLSAYESGRSEIKWSNPTEIHFRVYIGCWAAKHALAIDGDFVECGVDHGLLSRAICSYVDFQDVDKRFYLYDTFTGIPIETLSDPREIATAEALNKSHFGGNILPWVRERFKDYLNVSIVPGILPDALNERSPEKISYLSMDLNNAVAEMAVIEQLWDRVSIGGIVLLDDYAFSPDFAAQKQGWDTWAEAHTVSILTLPTGQGLIIKT